MLEDLDEVYASLQKEAFDLFIADCRGASTTALPFVENLCGMQKGLPVFLICDQWELDTVVRAIRLGVKDVFASPLDVKALIARAAEQLHKKHNGQMGTLEATQWSELIMLLSGNTSMFPPRSEKETKGDAAIAPQVDALQLQIDMLQRECTHLKGALEQERKKSRAESVPLFLPTKESVATSGTENRLEAGRKQAADSNGKNLADRQVAPDEIARREAELEKLRQELAAANAQLEKTESELLVLRQKGTKAETELASEKKRVAEAEHRVAAAEQRVATAEKARSELETADVVGTTATRELKERLAKAEAGATQAQKAQLAVQAEQQELNAQLEKVESELLMLRQKAAKTEAELAAEKKRVAEAEEREATAENLRSDLETTGAAAMAATKQLKERLAKAEATAAQSQKAQVAMQAEQAELNAQLEKAESELLTLR